MCAACWPPDFGNECTQVQWIKSREIRLGQYSPVDVNYDEPASRWTGWPQYEETLPQAISPEYVFGYGSLTSLRDRSFRREPSDQGFVTDLVGCRRTWGTAMDNGHDLPGYKYYLDQEGKRPPVYVTFLDIFPTMDSSSEVNGVCQPVSVHTLETLDARERNYERLDVTNLLTIRPTSGRVWAYVGSREGRGRAANGRAAGTAVVQSEYVESVRRGFAGLGLDELAKFETSTETLDTLPVMELTRRDLPQASR